MLSALLLVTAALSAPAADELPRAVTLLEAVAMAQQSAPEMVQAQGQARTSAAAVRSAYAAFLPSVSVSAGSTRRLPAGGSRTRVENGEVITLPSEPWSNSVGLGVSMTLFAGGQRLFHLRQAKVRAGAAGVNELSQRFAAALTVKQEFFNVLAARESMAAAQAQLEQANQQFRASVTRLKARTATRSDSLRSEIQLRNARLALMDARTSFDVANASLSRAVGSPTPVTAVETDTLGLSGITVPEGALRRMAEDGPAVRQAEAALAAVREDTHSAWSDYLPSVSLGYSRSGSGTGERATLFGDDDSYSGSIRLSLSLPVFNQLQREERVVQAQVAEQNAAAALRDARLGAREDFVRHLGGFRSAEERVASQLVTLEVAEEDLRVQRQRYAVGASTLLDLLTSQALLDSARRDLIRARYDQRVAKAQLEALVGRDL
jgi:outer membrane protein